MLFRDIGLLIRKNIKWILLFLALILFVEIVEGFYENELCAIDEFFYKYISMLICPPLTLFFEIMTQFGWIYVLCIIILGCLIIMKNKKFGFFLGLNALLVTMLNLALKNVFERPRPTGIALISEHGYSFPSGHSMISVAFYGFIIYAIWMSDLNKKLKIAFCSLLVCLILLIGLSRIYLGVHFVTDVVAGFCVSLVYLILYIKFVYRKKM